jgi:hypothetical protein
LLLLVLASASPLGQVLVGVATRDDHDLRAVTVGAGDTLRAPSPRLPPSSLGEPAPPRTSVAVPVAAAVLVPDDGVEEGGGEGDATLWGGDGGTGVRAGLAMMWSGAVPIGPHEGALTTCTAGVPGITAGITAGIKARIA